MAFVGAEHSFASDKRRRPCNNTLNKMVCLFTMRYYQMRTRNTLEVIFVSKDVVNLNEDVCRAMDQLHN